MFILGIESSCDDSGIALVENGKKIIFNSINSQFQEHTKHQGIVPELAARKHLDNFIILLDSLLAKKQLDFSHIDAIAVTGKPGLNSSLLMGITLAKSLSLIFNKPLIGINHLKAHFYSLTMSTPISFPYLGLLVSGGHTILVKAKSPLHIKIIGNTLDDSCGECLDKVAKYYRLGYPGGPHIEKLALKGNEDTYRFPTPLSTDKYSLNFSFSGLKTAVIHHKEKYLTIKNASETSINNKNDLAASLQKTIFHYLYHQIKKAIQVHKIQEIGICGGVSANQYLRKLFETNKELNSYFPPLALCTDNAAMVAGLAHEYLKKRNIDQRFTLISQPKNFKNRKSL